MNDTHRRYSRPTIRESSGPDTERKSGTTDVSDTLNVTLRQRLMDLNPVPETGDVLKRIKSVIGVRDPNYRQKVVEGFGCPVDVKTG